MDLSLPFFPFIPSLQRGKELSGAGGFEPPRQAPKACVLPLDDAPIGSWLTAKNLNRAQFKILRADTIQISRDFFASLIIDNREHA